MRDVDFYKTENKLLDKKKYNQYGISSIFQRNKYNDLCNEPNKMKK